LKVFITWSGAKSKEVALALREWIPDVLNNAKAWMSEVDIGAGERWSAAVATELESTRCGIICLSKSNLHQPWILFETGALAKSLADTYVAPYLIDLEPSDIPQGPLAQFQAKRANREGTFQLIQTLNTALGDSGIAEDRLLRNFNRCWPDLEKRLVAAAGLEDSAVTRRSVDDMVAEILDTVRGMSLKVRSSIRHIAEHPKQMQFYFREPGGRGEWLTEEEIAARTSKHFQRRGEPATEEEDLETEPGIPEDKRNPWWG